jgi:hypothetical protein
MHSARGPVVSHDEDWWRLVFDTDNKHLYVEHEWKHKDVSWRGREDAGTKQIEIADYLSEPGEGPGQHELLRLFSLVFEGQPDA